VISTDCIASCKFNYHAITTTTDPKVDVNVVVCLNVSVNQFQICNYLVESFANDELVVNMWQDKEEVSLFNFSIYKSTTQVAYIVCKFGIDLLKH
jgi:hypothetical protein